MPFNRKSESLFIGRMGELLFFVQNILKPEEPTHNIISISGQGGVGKSTLLTRFIAVCGAASFGVYLVHMMVFELLNSDLFGVTIGPGIFHLSLSIPITVLAIFVLSLLISIGLRKSPMLRWLAP